MKGNLRDYVEKWLFRAQEDVDVIDRLIECDPQAYASSICFHAQQAVEKYLKALLASEGVDFPKTHDVDFLLAESRKVTSGQLDSVDLKSLTEFGVSVRYPDDFYVPDISEVHYYAEVARAMGKLVVSLISFT